MPRVDTPRKQTRRATPWTIEDCRKIAREYSRRVDWQRGDCKSYTQAQRRGWLDHCCLHMGKPDHRLHGRPIWCETEGFLYGSLKLAAKSLGVSRNTIYKNIKFGMEIKRGNAKGFTFSYLI